MIQTSAPLKVVLAGEWAVLEPSASGFVVAITPRLFCEITSHSEDSVSISVIDYQIDNINATYHNDELIFTRPLSAEELNHLRLIKFSIETSLFFLNEFKPFKIRIWSSNPSSFTPPTFAIDCVAATIVAIHAAIHAFFGISLDGPKEKNRLFKLSLLTQFLFQNGSNSGIDIAAAIYGGIIHYKRYDGEWLSSKLENNFPFDLLIDSAWPNLQVNFYAPLPNTHLLLGYLPLLQSHAPPAIIREQEVERSSIYRTLVAESTKLVDDLTRAWKKHDRKRILSDIQITELYLKRLAKLVGGFLLPPELDTLCNIATTYKGAARSMISKTFFGGFALCFDPKTALGILAEWTDHDIIGAEMAIDFDGLKIEKKD